MIAFLLHSSLFPRVPRVPPAPEPRWVHVKYEGPAKAMEMFPAAAGLADKPKRKRRTGIGVRARE